MKLKSNDIIFGLLIICSSGLFLLFSCTASTMESSPKFKQYFYQGEMLYEKHCSNCHQKNGEGVGRLYPPLNNSDYLKDSLEASICLMRYGKKGKLIVNGKDFNHPMPGIPSLSELEVAEIATYIYNKWDQKAGIISVQQVHSILGKCKESQ